MDLTELEAACQAAFENHQKALKAYDKLNDERGQLMFELT